jgi:hypothetical protein
MKRTEAIVLVLLAALCAGPALAGDSGWQQVATPSTGSTTIEWQPQADAAGYVLTVSAPDGVVVRREFKAREIPSFSLFDANGQARADGTYEYELRAVPRIDKATREQLRAAREAGDEASVIAELQKAGRIPSEALVQSGSFTIAGGAFVSSDATEAGAGGGKPTKAVRDPNQTGFKDQVIPDDLIVQGSLCVGFDCVNNENFGFDTIRLKENNLRIKFEDTSVGAFPTNDWQLTANESNSGALSKFSIEDITGARVPFTVEAGATTNSIYVDSTGRVGFRTSTPVLDIHIATSNTPAIRLEQNNSGGFTAQTWDIAGNEANFFVRDVTGGSRLPFRIIPGAPTDSLRISSDGDVGIGTGSPSAAIDIVRSTGAVATVARYANNSGIQTLFDRTDVGASDWQMSNFNTTFQITVPGASPGQFSLGTNGNLTIGGTQYLTGSSRDLKENFVPVDGRTILQRVVDMPLTEWNAKTDPDQRHIGPVAEDWWATFQFGPDDKHVSPTDIGGVALAAIKGLHQVVAEKDLAITRLQQQNSELAARLAAIEQSLQTQNE